jgi:hypothetical protein
LDLSLPTTKNSDRAMCLYNLAEAYDVVGSSGSSISFLKEIGTLAERESFSGDIYAKSYYKLAKLYEYRWNHFPYPTNPLRTEAAENYRKFLSLWGDADPIFPEMADARARLAALEVE